MAKAKPKSARKRTSELTPKQRQFVAEYLIDLNATQAAVRAGYSPQNADKIGSQLLGKTRVAAAIKRAVDRRAKKLEIKADDVLRGIEKLTNGKKVPPAVRLKAFELLGKHLKLFTEKREVTFKGPAFKVYAGFDPNAV